MLFEILPDLWGRFPCAAARFFSVAHQQVHDVHFELFEVLLLDAGGLEFVVESLDLGQQLLEDLLGVDQMAVAVLIGLGAHGLDVEADAFKVAAVAEVVFVQDLDLVERVAQVVDAD